MKKAVRLVLSVMSVVSLMFLSCSTDSSSSGGSAPKFSAYVCDKDKNEKTSWERTLNDSAPSVFVASKDYKDDMEVKKISISFGDELNECKFTVNEQFLDDHGVLKVSLDGTPSKVGTYEYTMTVVQKSKPANKCIIDFKVEMKAGDSVIHETPTITKQPVGSTYQEGVTEFNPLTVEATAGDDEVCYQWYNATNVPIDSATNSSYTPTGAGEYYVKVWNKIDPSKYMISDKVSVIILANGDLLPPDITVDLKEKAEYPKSSQIEKLKIEAETKNGVVKYQWYKNNELIKDAENAVYAPDSFGSYYCRVISKEGDKESKPVYSKTITISESEMNITISGISDKSYIGETLQAKVTVDVDVNKIEYQWYKCSSGLSSGNDEKIVGAVSDVYTPDEEGYFTCKVTVTSKEGNTKIGANGKVCHVTPKASDDPVIPSINSEPKGDTIKEGGNITLSVEATVSDGGKLSYQWKKNGQSITGATSNEYSMTNVTTDDAGNYTVEVTNTLNGKNASKLSAVAQVIVVSNAGSADISIDFTK